MRQQLPLLIGAGVLTAATVAAPAATAQAASPIKHIVVIYEENHSFDSLLGFWCDANPGRCPDGGMPAQVTLADGATVTPSVAPDIVPQVKHTVESQQLALANKWDQIQGCAAPGYACISGYQPAQEPNLISLATTFAINDHTFSQQDSPSFGGHIYAVASNLDGFTGDNPPPFSTGPGRGWGCDSDKTITWGPVGKQVPSCVPDPRLPLPNGGAFEPTPVHHEATIMDTLAAAGLPWKIYGANCSTATVNPQGLSLCQTAQRGYQWNVCALFAKCLYGPQQDASNASFITDANTGTLPAFSLVTPGNAGNSEHNGFSMATGDNYIGNLVSAVMNGPDWGSTAIFLTWDDCGCFYDQVAPGLNPSGSQQGPRVPLVVVSPFAKPGFTDTTAATFASILAFTEHTFGLAPLGVNDGQAYDLSGLFSFAQRHLHTVPMIREHKPAGEHVAWAQGKQDT